MEEKKYIVAKGNTSEELERKVTSLLAKDYKCLGGVSVERDENVKVATLYQAMIKE